MRHDFYYGAIISLGIHFGIASLNPTKTPPLHTVDKTPEPPRIEVKAREDPPEVHQTGEEGPKSLARTEVEAPQLPDIPQPFVDGVFIVPPSPPVPDAARIKGGVVTIPIGRPDGGEGFGKPFELTTLDQQPVAKVQQKPVYPLEMKTREVSGEVLVDFIVGPNGEVRNAYAVRSSDREFEAAALQAVNKWKFRPGMKGGRAVSTHMQVPIVFTLHDGE